MQASETATRVAVAALAIPIALAAVHLGGWLLGGPLAVLAALGSLELYRLAEQKGIRPLGAVGATASAGFVLIATAVATGATSGLWLLAVGLTLFALVAAIWARGVDGEPLLALAVTLFGALYLGGLLSHGVLLRHLPDIEGAWHGTALVFAPVLLTWTNDTFAYFTGRALGRRKLIPRVSPGKTVEGALGALAGTILVAALYSEVLRQFDTYRIDLGAAIVFGVLVSVAAQLGDLAESLLKRDAGVKDSGTLFPGHGGVLDRLDSLLFTLPLAYLFFRFFVGPT